MMKLERFNEQHGIAVEQDGDLLSHERAVARDGRCAAPANVPYQIARGVEFYNRKEIKDVLAYLRVIANPADEVSLTRIVNVPPRGHRRTIPGLSARATNSITHFISLMTDLSRLASSRAGSAEEKGLVQTVMEEVVKPADTEAMLKESATTEEKGEAAIENVNQLVTAAAEYDAENPEGTLEGLPRPGFAGERHRSPARPAARSR